MYLQTFVASLAALCFSVADAVEGITGALRGLTTIDWNKIEDHQHPIQLEMKTFSDKDFDPAKEVIDVGERDAHEMDREEHRFIDQMKTFHEYAVKMVEKPQRTVNTEFIPKLKKLQID